MNRLKTLVSKNQMLFFTLIAFILGIPALVLSDSSTSPSIKVLLLFLASLAPAIAALVLSAITGTVGTLRSRATKWKVSIRWYLVSIVLPIATWVVASICSSLIGRNPRFSAAAALAFPIIFIANYVEEIGWRGFALPKMLRGNSPLSAGFYLGIIWILFHAPLYWQRPLDGLLFLAPILPISIILTWLFIRSDESVITVSLFHSVFNTVFQVLFIGESAKFILGMETVVLVIVAISIIIASDWSFPHVQNQSSIDKVAG